MGPVSIASTKESLVSQESKRDPKMERLRWEGDNTASSGAPDKHKKLLQSHHFPRYSEKHRVLRAEEIYINSSCMFSKVHYSMREVWFCADYTLAGAHKSN